MNEEFLYFVWKFSLHSAQLTGTQSESIKVLKPGTLNPFSGPDFSNAKIYIDGTVWAGNVEIHYKSSDWIKHGHSTDKAYDSIILHVVYENDVEIEELTFRKIPTVELRGRMNEKVLDRYAKFQKKNAFIPCENEISKVPEIIISSFKDRLLVERLESKSDLILSDLEETNRDWEEVFYRVLMRSFGFKANAEAMHQLSRMLPLRILWKHKHNEEEFHALLFGVSGLLPSKGDEYVTRLNTHYFHLKRKWSLESLNPAIWKRSGVRPANFPTLRLAQIASVLLKNENYLFSVLTDLARQNKLNQIKDLFKIEVSQYWRNHVVFSEKEGKNPYVQLGASSLDAVLINGVLPSLFHWSREMGQIENEEKALELYYSIKGEENSVIKKWRKLGISVKSSRDSQALLQLKNIYCSNKKCLLCHVGGYLLKR